MADKDKKKPSGAFFRKRRAQHSLEDEKQSGLLKKCLTFGPVGTSKSSCSSAPADDSESSSSINKLDETPLELEKVSVNSLLSCCYQW